MPNTSRRYPPAGIFDCWHRKSCPIKLTTGNKGCPIGDRRVHYDQTKAVALEVFADETVAETIAAADLSVDSEHRAGWNRDYWRHFDPLGWLPGRRDARESWAAHFLNLANKTGDRRYLGHGLHSLQDKAMHGFIPWEGRPWVWTKPSWRDNPRTNPQGAQQAEAAAKSYLQRYCRQTSWAGMA